MESLVDKEYTVVRRDTGVVVRGDCYSKVNTGTRNFIRSVEAPVSPEDLFWVDTNKKETVQNPPRGFKGIGNVHCINNAQRINKFLEQVNCALERGQYFVMCMETQDSRRIRILNKFPKLISVPYYGLDFILKRVFPKWKFTKKIYFWLTKGRNRVLSLTEGLGRLVSCGFEIEGHQRIGYHTYVLARKKADPAYDMEPTYGALVRLKRIGKDGKLFNVYKLRTMHPYSEYLQDFTFQKSSLQNGGKFKDDFRVTEWGKVFRKLWIDELPMIYNMLKGQMKLVGVRPLSRHYFSLYPESLQELRTKVKPGLVPPFYADMPETLEEITESERRYLESYLEKPIRTDIRYFFKAFYNIFFKGARSN